MINKDDPSQQGPSQPSKRGSQETLKSCVSTFKDSSDENDSLERESSKKD